MSQCAVSHHYLLILILYIHRQHQLRRREKIAVFNKILTFLSFTRQDMAIKTLLYNKMPPTYRPTPSTYFPKVTFMSRLRSDLHLLHFYHSVNNALTIITEIKLKLIRTNLQINVKKYLNRRYVL